jgi:hypothetical protein
MKAVGLKHCQAWFSSALNAFFVRFKLKRGVLFVLIFFALTAMVSAQAAVGNSRSPSGNTPRPAPEEVTITGSMTVVRGFPAFQSGEVTYFVGGTNRLVGFVDGLKEGAQVTIKGSARTVSQDGKTKFLMPKKMTINGKSYDLALPEINRDRLQQLRERFQRMVPPNARPGQLRSSPRPSQPKQPPRHTPPQPPRQKRQPPRQFPPRMPQQPWSNYGRR